MNAAFGALLLGDKVQLRPVTIDDCTDRYLEWLNDPIVSQYLETRWTVQTLDGIRDFVRSTQASGNSVLFAIIERATLLHIGNIKLGPVNRWHATADVSYFIGERSAWGRGLASESIRMVTQAAFERLNLERVEAGVYEANVGSARALERSGFALEGRLRSKFSCAEGRQDHLVYGATRAEWLAQHRIGQ